MLIVLMMKIWLLSISIMDIQSRRVPVWMLVVEGSLAAAAVICQFWTGDVKLFDALTGILPGIGLFLIALTTKKVGTGDGIVLIFLGVMSGWGKSMMIFGISLFLISICSVLLLILRKVKRNTGIPYLPFLTAGWILTDKLSV